MIARYAIGVALGFVVTFALFMIMQAVIANDEANIDEGVQGKLLDMVRLTEDEDIQTKQRKPKPPPPPDEPPPDMPKPEFDSSDVSQGVDVGAVDVNVDLNVGGGGFSSDGEYLPIVKVAPIYPRRAQTRGLEGQCLIEFTVTTTGTVKDAFAVDCTSSLFERASINAALKFKYKPRVVDGEAIEVPGVQHIITFKLED